MAAPWCMTMQRSMKDINGRASSRRGCLWLRVSGDKGGSRDGRRQPTLIRFSIDEAGLGRTEVAFVTDGDNYPGLPQRPACSRSNDPRAPPAGPSASPTRAIASVKTCG